MTPLTEMKPLSQTRRRIVFITALLLFLVAVPISVFYAIGYRFDFTGELTSIKSVGGMYVVTSDAVDTEIFVNDEPVEDMRVFQRAAYIQNLEAGMHQVHVQGEGVQTWVKELPVYAHFVTEVTSFNMPNIPQVRIITEYTDPLTSAGIITDDATTTLDFASTSNNLIYVGTSTATSSFLVNPEYAYVEALVASSTEARAVPKRELKPGEFIFDSLATSTGLMSVVPATTTRIWRDHILYESEGEIYVRYTGRVEDTPYYFCVRYSGDKKTASEYGEHVLEGVIDTLGTSTSRTKLVGERICRDSIRIDDTNKEVIWFDFVPNSDSLVLMHLSDGLYVVEVDDRAWQNTQLLYPGDDIVVVQDGGKIYVADKGIYMEISTVITGQ